MVATRSCRGAPRSVSAGTSPRRSAVRRSTAAHNPSMSPNWYLTAPHVAPMSLAIRLADAAPGPPEASDRNAASSMASRVAWPRRLVRRPVVVASGISGSYTPDLDFHRTYCDSWRMAKPPLSMKPTGWFQVAWSDEIGVGDVHRMKYFDREMIAWRAQSGQLTVMDAYCEHLGAHLGYGGHVEGEVIAVPVPRVAVEPRGPQRLHPVRGPAQPRPAHPDLSRWSSATSRSTSGTTSRAASPFFDAPDVFAELRRRQQRRRLLPAAAAVSAQAWRCIRSTSSRTVSTSRISSSCTRRRSCRCSPATTSTNRCPTSTSPSPSKVTTTRRSRTSTAGSRRSTAASASR